MPGRPDLEDDGDDFDERMNNELNFPTNFERLVLGCIDADFASKYSLESSRRDLQDLHTFAPLRSQNFSQKSSTVFRE